MEEKKIMELFRLTLSHKYYQDNLTGIFETEPTEAGQKALNSYGLYFKPRDDGFSVFTPCEPSVTAGQYKLVNPFTTDAKLSFVIFSNDKYFFDHSELPYDPPGKYIYYFNNLNKTERKTFLLLKKTGIKESERIKIHNKQFSGELKKGENNKIIMPVITDCHSNTVKQIAYDLEIDENKGMYYLDISRLEDGIYTIQYGTENQLYYCTKDSFIRRIPLIILEIFIYPLIAEEYSIIKTSGSIQFITPQKFTLYFGKYSLYWRYKFIAVNITKSIYIKLLANTGNCTFTPEKEKLSNCNALVTFTSNQLMDNYDDSFELSLYWLSWDEKCRCSIKFYYCNENYGIEVDNDFMCLAYKIVDGKKKYTDKCPARCEMKLIDRLPEPEDVPTVYYYEGDKYIAEMTLYLFKNKDGYIISDTSVAV